MKLRPTVQNEFDMHWNVTKWITSFIVLNWGQTILTIGSGDPQLFDHMFSIHELNTQQKFGLNISLW